MSTVSRVSPLSGLMLSRGKYDPPQRYSPFQFYEVCNSVFHWIFTVVLEGRWCFPILQRKNLTLRGYGKC